MPATMCSHAVTIKNMSQYFFALARNLFQVSEISSLLASSITDPNIPPYRKILKETASRVISGKVSFKEDVTYRTCNRHAATMNIREEWMISNDLLKVVVGLLNI